MFGYLSSLIRNPRETIIFILLAFPGRILAISAHEFAHAWVADKCGDPTARNLGRLTLNPMKHLDLMGTIMMLLLGFGWAKPVPINPRNYRNPRRDDLLVSLAGIAMNLILFLLSALVVCFISMKMQLHLWNGRMIGYIYDMFQYFMLVNISLAIFNLIPVPPLDGYHVLNDLLMKRSLFASEKAARTAMMVLFVLMFTGILGEGLSYVVNWAVNGCARMYFSLFDWIGLY